MIRRPLLAFIFIGIASTALAADNDVAKLAKSLSTGPAAARIQAADDLGTLGAMAIPAVPQLIEARKEQRSAVAMACCPRAGDRRPRR